MQITMTEEEEKAYLQPTGRSNPRLVQTNMSYSANKNAQQLLEGTGDGQPHVEVNSKSTTHPERCFIEKLPVEIQVLIAQQVSLTPMWLTLADKQGHITQRPRVFTSRLEVLEGHHFSYFIQELDY